MDSLGGTPLPVVVDGSPAILAYTAAQDQNGRLVLLWQGVSSEGVDIFYASYDPNHAVFSLVEQLTDDEPLEQSLAAAFGASGELLLAYNKTALEQQDITTRTGGQVKNATFFGQTDLYVLSHTFGPDLAWRPDSLTANPGSGGAVTISATLYNQGDEAVATPTVTFYLGNPADNGTEIDSVNSAGLLPGGGQVSLNLNWNAPSSGGPFTIYAVADAGHLVVETNEANNTAVLGLALPDLSVEHVSLSYPGGQTLRIAGRRSEYWRLARLRRRRCASG